MNCVICNFQLPDGARVCPQCGNLVSPPNTSSGVSYSNPTIASAGYHRQQPISSYDASAQSMPPVYDPYSGETPYAGQTPYGVSTSYGGPGTVPPPPRLPAQGKQGKRIALVVGIAILLILLVGEGSFLLFGRHGADQQDHQAVTPTAMADQMQNPYIPNTGTLVMNDAMKDNSKGYKWDEATMNDANGSGQSSCGFTGDVYHLTKTAQGAVICDPEAPVLTLSNVTFEASCMLTKGNGYGIAVRVDQTKGTGYLFELFDNGTYGLYAMNWNAPQAADQYKTLRTGTNAAIKQGLNQTNMLAITANGNTISAFANGQIIDSIQDSTYTKGQLAFYASASSTADMVVSGARAWQL